MTKVVILCGGYGLRIRNVTENLPKPMIPIGEYPILWHIMKYYAEWGHNQFILCLGYKGEVIRDFFMNYRSHVADFSIDLSGNKPIRYYNSENLENWNVTLAETGMNSMTGSRIKMIQKYLCGDDIFLLTYGDGVGTVNIQELIEFHKSHGKILTVTGVRPPGRFGEIQCDDFGLITEFNEKPQTTGGRISGGYFVCRKEIFNYIDEGEDCIFEQETMRNLVKNEEVMEFKHNDFWQPMDTSREYQYLNELYQQKKAPWVIW